MIAICTVKFLVYFLPVNTLIKGALQDEHTCKGNSQLEGKSKSMYEKSHEHPGPESC